MAASPMAETTGAAVRCPHAAGRERPGHFWPESGSGVTSGRPAGRRLAARYGPRREKAPPPWLPTVAQPLASAVNQAAELRLCPNPPQPYAHIVILAAQKAANRHK